MNEKDKQKKLREVMTRATERILTFTLDHGTFGMQTLDGLHEQLPATTCECCGECCFSIAFYSLEYHRIVRYLAENFSPGQCRKLFYRALNPSERLVTVDDEERMRCIFLDDETKKCTIYPVRPFMCRVFGQEFDGVRECERVQSEGKLTSEMLETVATRIATCSEQFKVPTEDGEDVVDFFPIEFFVIRALDGPERAMEWFLESPFYAKYLKQRTLLKLD